MPTTYSGFGRTISSTLNTAPITVNTSIAHGLLTNAQVIIVGATVTAVNGLWTITVTSGTQFTLNGTAAPGSAGGAAGTVFVGPGSIQIPSDGDTRNALSVNAAFQGLADLAAYLYSTQGNLRVATPANGTNWVCPPGVNFALVIGWGGGGGGGSGAGAGQNNNYWIGGGGGGSAPISYQVITPTPGSSYAVTLGGGGAGGAGVSGNAAGGTNGNNGSDGALSALAGLASFQGGAGGFGGLASATSQGTMAWGGSAAYQQSLGYAGMAVNLGAIDFNPGTPLTLAKPPNTGGFGLSSSGNLLSGSGIGTNSPQGWTGGAAGSHVGAPSAPRLGGGPGGGGAAGPGGGGAAGGGGGDATPAGVGNNGLAGSSAAAGSGAGGGGSGAGGGSNNSTGGNSLAGGTGGSGKIYIVYVAGPNQ